jgi:hypothetical protein
VSVCVEQQQQWRGNKNKKKIKPKASFFSQQNQSI